ncbi:cytolytic toxin-alpha-like isoform X2 [Megalobrama amblycephala]|uniref:cytolytic toxin-alpha-like isoform X2 n=1 Tax=Megalobrama amblycephala TaxID=75352 RepID=UPI002013E846|nr:cytolytic toxin-alpha-like isoform X2 [Megalobrama amblycephala]
MVVHLTYMDLLKYIYLFTYLWLATPAAPDTQELSAQDARKKTFKGHAETPDMDTDHIEVAALGRPLFPGMLYDCRKDSFIPGITLWDKKSLKNDLDTHPQPQTDLKFSSSDSLSDKSSLMDISASLKVSFLGGLVEVRGSAKYLHDTKSSNQQSRVTIYYRETTRFEQLTMTQLGNITYPEVFDQKTATHVVTAVLYGAQAFMVFDRTFSKEEKEQDIEGELNVMVKNIPEYSIEGKGSVNMTDNDKKIAENIACTFHGDIHLEQNPTTYMDALDLYKQLPTLLKENPQNAVPVKVWLFPLHLLNTKAAQLVREISTSLVSNTEDIMKVLDEAERTSNDLLKNTLVNVFRDLKERLLSFQDSFRTYKTVLQKAVSRVLPAIRGEEGMKEKSLEDILKIHYESPFNAGKLNQWLDDANSELNILSSSIEKLEGIKIENSDGLNTILLDPDIDVVVCFTFTSLNEDPYVSALKEFLKSDKFKELDKNETLFSVASGGKWINDPDVIKKMRDNLSNFRGFSEANKDEKKIRFIMSVISNPSNKGSSIYLYEKGKLKDTQFQPVTKPPPPIVKGVQSNTVSLKLQKSPTGETVKYRVEYKQEKNQWLFLNTPDEDFTLTGLVSGKQYLIRYRIVGIVGVSEASDTVSSMPSSVQPKTIPDRCWCLETKKYVRKETVEEFSIFPIRPRCNNVEIILTLKPVNNFIQRCLNPNSAQGKNLQTCWKRNINNTSTFKMSNCQLPNP